MGSSCHAKGARTVAQEMQDLILQENLSREIQLTGAFCMGRCQEGVCVTVDGAFFSISPKRVKAFFETEILPRMHLDNHI